MISGDASTFYDLYDGTGEPELGEVTLYLINKGIYLNHLFNERTALDAAMNLKHYKAEKLLRSLGAKTSEELKLESKENKA